MRDELFLPVPTPLRVDTRSRSLVLAFPATIFSLRFLSWIKKEENLAVRKKENK